MIGFCLFVFYDFLFTLMSNLCKIQGQQRQMLLLLEVLANWLLSLQRHLEQEGQQLLQYLLEYP